MQLHRKNEARGELAPESTFTGDVRISDYVRRPSPSRLAGARVDFAPGARTPWKVNPIGQTIVVLSGVGRAHVEGGEVVELRPGDVCWFPPGERHWEGAGPDTAMSCLAVQEETGGADGTVRFLEEVTDAEYCS